MAPELLILGLILFAVTLSPSSPRTRRFCGSASAHEAARSWRSRSRRVPARCSPSGRRGSEPRSSPRRARWACVIAGWGIAQYPFLVPPHVTVEAAKSPEPVLRVALWAILAGTAVLLPSLTYLFTVFKSER